MSSPRNIDQASPHTPVMMREVIDALQPRDGAILVDGTFGAGGYTRALLAAADCTVWAIDRDPDAVAAGRRLVAECGTRLQLREGRFGEMAEILAAEGIAAVDGVALDLGVSSMQIDQAERGFSFRMEGPLDMRMERSGPTAADLIATIAEADLADIIFRFGDERRSRRIARAIVQAREMQPIDTTGRLASIVRRAAGGGRDDIDPATRTFQALRIAVNDEIGEVERGLEAAERVLAPGGRIAVVSFHSLEDRPVKAFLRERSGSAARESRHLPDRAPTAAPTFVTLHRRALRPTKEEVAGNPRARSARLRTGERTAAPARSGGSGA